MSHEIVIRHLRHHAERMLANADAERRAAGPGREGDERRREAADSQRIAGEYLAAAEKLESL